MNPLVGGAERRRFLDLNQISDGVKEFIGVGARFEEIETVEKVVIIFSKEQGFRGENGGFPAGNTWIGLEELDSTEPAHDGLKRRV